MADLTNGSGVFQTYNNAGTGVAELGDNKAAGISQGIAGRTVIVKVAKTNISQAELDTMVVALTQGGTYTGVTNDAFTVVGVSADTAGGSGVNTFEAGVSDVVFFALQGTGNITADASDALGVTGAALTVEAVFDQDSGADISGAHLSAQLSGNFS